ncbi:aminotransferase class I/II-fold pyridoxal phosphate-dependent enzyme, partial [bacterium]|nr:aminotransferase class I/II-fold pyridoxal phosphate-dependent enzyme [bacterium]
MNKMKFPVYEPEITEREIELVTQTIRDGWIGSKGPFVRKFETLFAEWIGADDSLTSSNGTCSLHLAVEALGLGEGDEILVPNLTFIATANVVVFAGAKPVFVDIEPTSFGMDPEQIKSKITSKTRAIMPVHLYGHPAKMDEIMKIAKENDLFVIEDASEAIGA